MGRARYTLGNTQISQMRAVPTQLPSQAMLMQSNRMMQPAQANPAVARYQSNFPAMMSSSRSSMPGRQPPPQTYGQNYSATSAYLQNLRKSNEYYGNKEEDY